MERPLEGKVAVITGASRGIGKQIALKLAEAGANIVGNSVDSGKQKRVDSVMEEIRKKGSHVSWSIGDVTTEQGRKDLWMETFMFNDDVHYLFLNAAGGLETDKEDGWAEKINVDSPLALVKAFTSDPDFSEELGFMKSGSKIIYLTSLWAENFGKVKQPPFYRPVARTKYLAERRLRGMIPDLEKRGISLGFLCGDIIYGTAAHSLMSKRFPNYISGLEKTAENGEFPTTEDMGEAALGMVTTEFKSGHTEYVGKRDLEPIDPLELESFTWNRQAIKRRLPMYGDSKLYVDEFISPKEDELGYAKETGIGRYTVRSSDTKGHFAGKFKDLKIFRGVDREEAAAQTLGLIFLALEPDLKFVPMYQGLNKVRHKGVVSVGETIDMYAQITYMNSQEVRGNCEIKIGDEVVTEVSGINLGLLPGIDVARRMISLQKTARSTKGGM